VIPLWDGPPPHLSADVGNALPGVPTATRIATSRPARAGSGAGVLGGVPHGRRPRSASRSARRPSPPPASPRLSTTPPSRCCRRSLAAPPVAGFSGSRFGGAISTPSGASKCSSPFPSRRTRNAPAWSLPWCMLHSESPFPMSVRPPSHHASMWCRSSRERRPSSTSPADRARHRACRTRRRTGPRRHGRRPPPRPGPRTAGAHARRARPAPSRRALERSSMCSFVHSFRMPTARWPGPSAGAARPPCGGPRRARRTCGRRVPPDTSAPAACRR
jgi:hypothetical protein